MIPLQRLRDDPESIRQGARLKGEEAPIDEILEARRAGAAIAHRGGNAPSRTEARVGGDPRRPQRGAAHHARRAQAAHPVGRDGARRL